MKIEEIMARAAQSDEYNDWDALGDDEREALLLIMKSAIAALGQSGYGIQEFKVIDFLQSEINYRDQRIEQMNKGCVFAHQVLNVLDGQFDNANSALKEIDAIRNRVFGK